jgi:hypothetical protein
MCLSSQLDGHGRNQSPHNNGAEIADEHCSPALSLREAGGIAIPEIEPNLAPFAGQLAIRW